MKKIIAVVDAFNFTHQELESYKFLAREARGELTILILESVLSEAVWLSNTTDKGDFNYKAFFSESKARQSKAAEYRQQMADFYLDQGVGVTIRQLSGVASAEVLLESRFADLLIIRNDTSFSLLHEEDPPRFVVQMLAKAECPVLIIPEKVYQVSELIFTYNGTSSSSFAIRQFSALFEDFSDVPAKVVYVAETGDKKMPFGKMLKEYLDLHYDDVTAISLEGTPSAELLAFLLHRKNCIVTLGAYGRSQVSRFFHQSDANVLLRTLNIPIFITHP